MKKNQRGFSAVEGLLFLIVLGLIGFVAWYVYHTKNTVDKTLSTSNSASTTSSAEGTTLDKKYSDGVGNFSVKYPANWKLVSSTASDSRGQSSIATLTSPTGTVLNLDVDLGGKGGDCVPASGDKAFQANNTCPSWEYLSSEVVPINNVYYAADTDQPDGSISIAYKKTNIVLATIHYADPSGKSTYLIGLTQSNESEPVVVNSPQMGLYAPEEFFTVYDSSGKFEPYIYAFATGSSSAFLTSKDADTIKSILRSMQINI